MGGGGTNATHNIIRERHILLKSTKIAVNFKIEGEKL